MRNFVIPLDCLFSTKLSKGDSMAKKKKAAKKKKSSTVSALREVAQTIFPGAKRRQARRQKRRTAVKKAMGIKSKK
jgi:hypothetical protein